jgi:hypothetical protein
MSSINPNNIDGSYPIAGQDNDSQGFRDNFTNIKNNFTFAAAELKDLQDNAILKTALSGTTLDNNLNNAILKGAQLQKTTLTKNSLGSSLTGGVAIDWSTGHFQTIDSTAGSITLTFSGWPTSGFWTSFMLEINVSSTAHTLTLPAAVSVNNTNIKGIFNNVITFATTGKHYFEFSTYDGGTTITLRDLTRNYDTNTVDYQIYKPTANVAVTGNIGINKLLLAPTGTIVSFGANVTLPNTRVNGTTFAISSNVAVSGLAVTASWTSSVNPFGNVTLTAGQSVEYTYVSADDQWYKTR